MNNTLQRPDGVILEAIVGSQAYGLAHADSDEDRMGVFVAPLQKVAGLDWHARHETHVDPNVDATWHEVGKFLRLVLKGNPTIVELLFASKYTILSSLGADLIARPHDFLDGGNVKSSYLGYAGGQIKLFERTGRAKSARHCLRIIEQGIDLLSTGEIDVKVRDPEYYFSLSKMDSVDVLDVLHSKITLLEDAFPYRVLGHTQRHVVDDWLWSVRKSTLKG